MLQAEHTRLLLFVFFFSLVKRIFLSSLSVFCGRSWFRWNCASPVVWWCCPETPTSSALPPAVLSSSRLLLLLITVVLFILLVELTSSWLLPAWELCPRECFFVGEISYFHSIFILYTQPVQRWGLSAGAPAALAVLCQLCSATRRGWPRSNK